MKISDLGSNTSLYNFQCRIRSKRSNIQKNFLDIHHHQIFPTDKPKRNKVINKIYKLPHDFHRVLKKLEDNSDQSIFNTLNIPVMSIYNHIGCNKVCI